VSVCRLTLAEVRKLPATIDVETAAAALGVSRSTAYEAIRLGTLPSKVVTVMRRKTVITASVLELLEGGDGVGVAP
jgi:predicted DNA-binding transcriptional regulator AlpA